MTQNHFYFKIKKILSFILIILRIYYSLLFLFIIEKPIILKILYSSILNQYQINMFQTKPFKPLNQITHKSRLLLSQFKHTLHRIVPTTPNNQQSKTKVKNINNIFKTNKENTQIGQANSLKDSFNLINKHNFQKVKQMPLLKAWVFWIEKTIIKTDKKTKGFKFFSYSKVQEILNTFQTIKFNNSFYVYPSNQYQSLHISYSEFVYFFIKLNQQYIKNNINYKGILQKLFRSVCQCLQNLYTNPFYSKGSSVNQTIKYILQQNNLIFSSKYEQQKQTYITITRQKIYDQKYQLYNKASQSQSWYREFQKNNGINHYRQSDSQNDTGQKSNTNNKSFLSQLNKQQIFSDHWNRIIQQRQKQGFQQIQKNKMQFQNGNLIYPTFKRTNRQKKLDTVLESIQKFKKQSQYMIKMLEDRLSY